MELMAVTAVLGLLVSMAVPYFGHSTLANAGARGFARTLAIDCLRAQRRAISTGDNHLVKFTKNAGAITDYALFHNQGGTEVQIDDTRSVPVDVAVTSAADEFELMFTGEAVATAWVIIQGPDRGYITVVIAATGKAFTFEF